MEITGRVRVKTMLSLLGTLTLATPTFAMLGCGADAGSGSHTDDSAITVTSDDNVAIEFTVHVTFEPSAELEQKSPPDGSSFVHNMTRAAMADSSNKRQSAAILANPAELTSDAQAFLDRMLKDWVTSVHLTIVSARRSPFDTSSPAPASSGPAPIQTSAPDASGPKADAATSTSGIPSAATSSSDGGIPMLPSPKTIATSRPECGTSAELNGASIEIAKDVAVAGSGATLRMYPGVDLTILPCTLTTQVKFSASYYTLSPVRDPAYDNVPFENGATGFTITASTADKLTGTVYVAWNGSSPDMRETAWLLRDGAWVQIPSVSQYRFLESTASGSSFEPIVVAAVPLAPSMTVALRK